MPEASKIFVRNRALGYVSNHVPCATWYLKSRKEHIVVSCVGKAYHTYGLNHLSLFTVSDLTENEITCIATDRKRIYTANGGKIQSWRRGTVIADSFGNHEKPIHVLLPFGSHIISVDEDNLLKVWDSKSKDLFLELTFDPLTFRITSAMHPSTYLNKILIGSEQGAMQLWNIKTSKLIHTFEGWGASVQVLQQAPALDVVAVGLNDGRIILHNIMYDEMIVEFTQDWGPVTAISFRTDGQPIMATGSVSGHVVLWNLEERKVASQILEAHNGAVCSAICLPNEPLMITSSSDNSVKLWIFDQPDFGARLLRLREGHAVQPNHIRFYPGNPVHVLSAAGDSSLRVFNAINESMNFSMGRAYYNRKTAKKNKEYAENLLMPPITEFSSATVREKDWDNIAALHLGSPLVTSWSYDKRRMGEHKLLPERLVNTTRVTLNVTATCIHLTSCGNFIVIGYSSGHVDRFNIQSGIQRCSYGAITAHKRSIRGVAVDPLNQLVLTGCGDGFLKFWKFKPDESSKICSKPLSRLTVGEPISFFRVHKESSLIGVVLEDFTISLVDIDTRKVVRKIIGHSGQVTDCTFSPDARWLISASMDATVRTWDIPTASLIDIFRVESPCISIDMSPTGQYLATAHVNYLGIYLWANRTTFSYVSFKAIKIDAPVPLLDLPGTRGPEPIALEELDDEEDENEEDSVDQIECLATLSGLATSRWQNLLDIDIIKKRNKPVGGLKKPEVAPFFLPTLPTKDIQFDFSSVVNEEDSLKTLRLDRLINKTVFGQFLEKSVASEDFKTVVNKLKEMGPSAIDFEINSMSFDMQGSDSLLLSFLKTLRWMFSTNRDFELAQSYLSLFVKVHSNAILVNQKLQEMLKDVLELQLKNWDQIQGSLMYCLSVIDALKQQSKI
ncbi:WD repeat-containing protein 36 [Cimex lectularius]|uniref:WD repeat-containing protein 55 homolog n=1 Tax=Cimex lectularius TaxID=79782 RepID=A0A8I6RMW4_CIMLE|nr:WD repeat-containing protein 36 [Cimex lectularius]